MSFLNLAFYQFTPIVDPLATRDLLRGYFYSTPIRGTILVSPEGINGMLSGPESDLRLAQEYLKAMPEFAALEFKESWSSHVGFTRMLVKAKKEIIPAGMEGIDPLAETGPRVKPQELKQWLDEGRDLVLLDTRNEYEVSLGTFEKAVTLGLRHFRDFPKKLADATELKNKSVVMFCTGGIRCEKATAVALKAGFQDVYQLDGGILKYFEEVGSAHYKGDCFVFDERIAVKPDLSEATGHSTKLGNRANIREG